MSSNPSTNDDLSSMSSYLQTGASIHALINDPRLSLRVQTTSATHSILPVDDALAPIQHGQFQFLALPLEIQRLIYGCAFQNTTTRLDSGDTDTARILIRLDIDNPQPLIYKEIYNEDQHVFFALRLVSRRFNTEVMQWTIDNIFPRLRLAFHGLKDPRILYRMIGANVFGGIRVAEIVGLWAQPTDQRAVEELKMLVQRLPRIQDFSVLWVYRSYSGWTNAQLYLMTSILEASQQLKMVYHADKCGRIRFCSGKHLAQALEEKVILENE